MICGVYFDEKMIAEAVQPSVPVFDVPFFNQTRGEVEEIMVENISSKTIDHRVKALDDLDAKETKSDKIELGPRIRSGSFADKGPRRCMEDEHVMIDDLSSYLGSLHQLPVPSAFYGVFDGHGGAEAATYVKENATRLFLDDLIFPPAHVVDDSFSSDVEGSLRKAFLMADIALAEDSGISTSSGTTALTVFVVENTLMVANAGDCRAVLCRKGVAVDMSHDHRPTAPSEKRRVEESGGFVDDGYLNGVLSVSRSLGDWDVKFAGGTSSPLIADPEVNRITLNEDDEFLIVACDGVWDVMSSQHAVNVARRQLARHGDPYRCAKGVAMEALRYQTFDNVTVIVVCLYCDHLNGTGTGTGAEKGCSLSSDAMCRLQSLLDGNSDY